MAQRADKQDEIYDEAVAWHAALAAPSADWEGFTLWLEADPAHRDIYDGIASIDDELTDYRPVLAAILPETDRALQSVSTASPRRGWLTAGRLRWGAGLTALAVAVPLALVWQAAAPVNYQTGATSRRIALADGSTVLLGPRSALVVADANAITLRRGAAYFVVTHRPDRSLTIIANGYRISDVGTTFDVNVADGTRLMVAVADGQVAVGHTGLAQPVTVRAGQRLNGGRGGSVRIDRVDNMDVGSWRTGQLAYTNTALALVAADIARHSGTAVAVDPAIADQTFSGVLAAADGTHMINDLALIMDITVIQTAEGVRLAPRSVR